MADLVPQLKPMPKLFRDRIRDAITDPKARESFDGLLAWEDDILVAFNPASTAADRMATTLKAIEDTAYGKFESKGDYAAFIRDLARNGRLEPS